jgi:hypothetical protein
MFIIILTAIIISLVFTYPSFISNTHAQLSEEELNEQRLFSANDDFSSATSPPTSIPLSPSSISSSDSFYNPPVVKDPKQVPNKTEYDAEFGKFIDDQQILDMIYQFDKAIGNDAIANQKKADEHEAKQIARWNLEAEMKANGSMPVCKEGENPLSEWMKEPKTINENGLVEFSVIKETCVEPEKKMGAVILFPID